MRLSRVHSWFSWVADSTVILFFSVFSVKPTERGYRITIILTSSLYEHSSFSLTALKRGLGASVPYTMGVARAAVLLASLQLSLAFFGVGWTPQPAKFPFKKDSRNEAFEESAEDKLRAVRGMPVAHKSVMRKFAIYSAKRAATDTLKNEASKLLITNLDRGEAAIDGCLTAYHVELVRKECGHFVDEDAAMGAISCTKCATKMVEEGALGAPTPSPDPLFQPAAAFHGRLKGFEFKVGVHGAGYYEVADKRPVCSKQEVYRICDKMMASDWLKKQHAAQAHRDYVEPEFRPEGGFTSTYSEIGACLLGKIEEIMVIVADLASCTKFIAGKTMRPNSRCYAYTADNLAKRTRECCIGYEKVVVGRRAETECKADALKVIKDLFIYVKAPFDFCVQDAVKGGTKCQAWAKQVNQCSDDGWGNPTCLFSVSDFLHPAFRLLSAAQKYYALGSPEDKTRKAHNLLTICDKDTMELFNSALERIPGCSFIEENLASFPHWAKTTAATWKKKHNLLKFGTKFGMKGLNGQGICTQRMFTFVEKHGSAFGDPIAEEGDPDDPDREWRRRLRGVTLM